MLFLTDLRKNFIIFESIFKSNRFRSERDEPKQLVNSILNSVSKDSKVWIIWQNSKGFPLIVCRYELMPIKIINAPWTLGTKYFEGDVWTQNLSKEDFQNYLRQAEYVALGNIDDKFKSIYFEFFKDKNSNILKAHKIMFRIS